MVLWGTGTVWLAAWMTVNEARVGEKQKRTETQCAPNCVSLCGTLKGCFWEARRHLEVRKGDVITSLHTQGPVGSFGLQF